jgi:hypothetical protein
MCCKTWITEAPPPHAPIGLAGCAPRALLVIEVTNARDVVSQRIGRLGSRLIGRVVDAEAQVEKALLQELENAFKEFGIEARIYSIEGPQMLGRSHLEIPVHVRGEREVRLGAEPGRARESD